MRLLYVFWWEKSEKITSASSKSKATNGAKQSLEMCRIKASFVSSASVDITGFLRFKYLCHDMQEEVTDLSKFADSSYDFSTTPKKGGKILAEHGKKVIEPLLNIADKGDLNIDGIVAGGKIPNSFDDSLIEYVNTLANESVTGSSSSCRGACSGLCTETC